MAGRPKGAKNKITTAARELALQLGVNPLEVLLRFAKGDWEGLGYEDPTMTKYSAEGPIIVERIPPELRMTAAKEAVKYIYPTQKAVEFTSEDGEGGFKVIIEDYTKGK